MIGYELYIMLLWSDYHNWATRSIPDNGVTVNLRAYSATPLLVGAYCHVVEGLLVVATMAGQQRGLDLHASSGLDESPQTWSLHLRITALDRPHH
ncbi:hypothetical protein CFAM422_002575 [Trichoderma lentiforme]|uniref:Uncharacterized protein n=1 Tax=Trichoderma lentiforme TaxID=1567552 RepID=A0A9P4XLF1_9HYPO|nr:hypothetical protein CFAM422_002575 [Trichoderma lentiforme]